LEEGRKIAVQIIWYIAWISDLQEGISVLPWLTNLVMSCTDDDATLASISFSNDTKS